jgi:hypothetical protein
MEIIDWAERKREEAHVAREARKDREAATA